MSSTRALQDVIAERERQITEEGFTPEKDRKWGHRELAKAGAAYALFGALGYDAQIEVHGVQLWPWHQKWWKPTTRRRALVKAAALIIAEIERVDDEFGIRFDHASDGSFWVMVRHGDSEQMKQIGKLVAASDGHWLFYLNGTIGHPLSGIQLQKIQERLRELNATKEPG